MINSRMPLTIEFKASLGCMRPCLDQSIKIKSFKSHKHKDNQPIKQTKLASKENQAVYKEETIRLLSDFTSTTLEGRATPLLRTLKENNRPSNLCPVKTLSNRDDEIKTFISKQS